MRARSCFLATTLSLRLCCPHTGTLVDKPKRGMTRETRKRDDENSVERTLLHTLKKGKKMAPKEGRREERKVGIAESKGMDGRMKLGVTLTQGKMQESKWKGKKVQVIELK